MYMWYRCMIITYKCITSYIIDPYVDVYMEI